MKELKFVQKIKHKRRKNKDLPFTIEDFSKELISLINHVYKNDFELFDYEMKNV